MIVQGWIEVTLDLNPVTVPFEVSIR